MSKKFAGQPGGRPEFSSPHFQKNRQFSKNLEQKSAKRFDKSQGKEDFRIAENAGGAVETFKQYNQVMQAMSSFERGVANTLFKEGVSPGQAREKLSRSRIPEAGRSRIEFALLLALAIAVFLAACGVPMTELPETLSPPTASAPATETMSADESTPAAVTEAATEAPDFDASYFTYDEEVEQHQKEADSILEKNWALIYEKIIKAGIAVNFEVTCITGNNFCIKPSDGYPPGTYFVISDIPGFEGQVLTVTTGKASEVAGVPVVEITLGNNGNPVGLDANGKVVAYVNEKGAWQKGEIPLAADLVDDLETAGEPAGDYDSMTNEEKLAQSQNLVEQANGYSGEVHVELPINGTTYNIYWDATRNEWRSDHNTPAEELDKTGESFPELVMPGYQNPDGTLVLVDPVTGKETVFPKPILPGKGEMSLQEFYNLPQSNLGTYIIDGIVVPALDPTNSEAVQTAQAMKQQALFLAGYTYGEQNRFYAGQAGVDPEEGGTLYEVTTNQFLVPIFSPKTGEFMFFLNIQQGNPISTMIFSYDQDNNIEFKTAKHDSNQNLGGSSQNEFGITVENRTPKLSHWEGGMEPLLQGNKGIGSVTELEAILNAKTEAEILNILKKYKVFVSYPSRVVIPKR